MGDRWRTSFLWLVALLLLSRWPLSGLLVTKLIETELIRNSAAITSLHADSIITPLLPEIRTIAVLDEKVRRSLDKTLRNGALGRRLVSFKLWRRDGTILYSREKTVVSYRYEANQDLARAFAGDMTAQFRRANYIDGEAQYVNSQPMLEIYNPVLNPWSGEVVAVSELFEIAPELERSLQRAAVLSWLAVASVTLVFFLILSAVVFRVRRENTSQSRALEGRVREISDLLVQNKSLRRRIQRASHLTTALNESLFRRLSAELHDGPAQLVALASLKLDSSALLDPSSSAEEREHSAFAIKLSLDGAMREIRSMCNGLVLPHIESAQLTEVLALAVSEHEQRTDARIDLSLSNPPQLLSPSAKVCIYRFIQEALNNGYRHSNGARQSVMMTSENGVVFIEVCDKGPGFDPAVVRSGCLGLVGLRERVESLGGGFEIETSENGTKVKMFLNVDEVIRA